MPFFYYCVVPSSDKMLVCIYWTKCQWVNNRLAYFVVKWAISQMLSQYLEVLWFLSKYCYKVLLIYSSMCVYNIKDFFYLASIQFSLCFIYKLQRVLYNHGLCVLFELPKISVISNQNMIKTPYVKYVF